MTHPRPSWPTGDDRPVEGAFFPVPPLGTAFVGARFAAVVDRFADRPAVGDLDRSITFGELSRRIEPHVDRLGTDLPPGPVVVAVSDPVDLAIGILATLVAGRACLLADPGRGPERFEALLEVVGGSVVLVGTGASSDGPTFAVPGTSAAAVDGVRAMPAHAPSDVVVFLNTSGSTGAPKLVAQRSVLGVGFDLPDMRAPRSPEHVATNLSMTGATFVRCLRALLSGDRFTAFSLDARAPAALLRSLADLAPTHLALTPTVLRQLAMISERTGAVLSSLGTIRVVGEPLRWSDVAAARRLCGPGVTIENSYGAMEVGRVCMRSIPPDEAVGEGLTSVGRPIEGRDVWIAGEDGSPAPPDTIGTIVVEGTFTTDGIELEDLGAGRSRFRSSDLGRLDASGDLWLAGRSDRTVKVAGMRLDPAVAEEALLKVPGVLDAVVVPVVIGADTRLIAQVILDPTSPQDASALRAALAVDLPGILLPARFVVRTEPFPLLAFGKKDLRALARETQALLAGPE